MPTNERGSAAREHVDVDAVHTQQRKYVAAPELWKRSTTLLASVLDRSGRAYEANEGRAAFYGPTIDVQVAGTDLWASTEAERGTAR